jgi:hypothetical protein
MGAAGCLVGIAHSNVSALQHRNCVIALLETEY